MNKKETAQILAILKEYYPRDLSSTDIITKVDAWYLIMKDYDYNLMQNAVIAFVSADTNGFMPTIGQLIEKSKSIIGVKELSEVEAWNMVMKALSNSAYNSKSEFEKLPTPVKRAVGSAEMLRNWSQLDLEEINTVIQSNFMRSYKQTSKQEKEADVIPQITKKFMLELAGKFDMKELGQ